MKKSVAVLLLSVLAVSLSAQAGLVSMTPEKMAGLNYWWGDMSRSAAVADGACRYTLELSGKQTGWGEEARLVNWWHDDIQVGDVMKQRFVSSTNNPYSIEVKLYYTVDGAPDDLVKGVLNPGDELTLSLDVVNPVGVYGIVFVTSYWTGSNPTTAGATGTLVVDAYQVPEPATLSVLGFGALSLLKRRKIK